MERGGDVGGRDPPLASPTRSAAPGVRLILLAVLVATTGISIDQPPAASGKTAHVTPDQRPALVKTIDGFRDWLREWRQWADKHPPVVDAIHERLTTALRVAEDTQADRQGTRRVYWSDAPVTP